MQTKFDIGDKVLVPFEVVEILVTNEDTVYKMKNISKKGGVDTTYRSEEEIYGLE